MNYISLGVATSMLLSASSVLAWSYRIIVIGVVLDFHVGVLALDEPECAFKNSTGDYRNVEGQNVRQVAAVDGHQLRDCVLEDVLGAALHHVGDLAAQDCFVPRLLNDRRSYHLTSL